MRLYDMARVEAAEKLSAWQTASLRAMRRSAAAKKAAEQTAEKLIERAEKAQIEVQVLPPSALLAEAIRHYEDRQEMLADERGWLDVRPVGRDAPSAFLERIQVNFIRHQKTRYERLLDQQFQQVGALKARRIITERVFQAIARAYPALQKECARQAAVKRLEAPAHREAARDG